MDGVRTVGANDRQVIVVEYLSEELKDRIRERLSEYCHGAVRAAEDAFYYSYDRTIAEFLRRFDGKPPKIQTGMIGELLVHMFAPIGFPALTSGAIFFNKEERSMKKGFDLTFYEAAGRRAWYGEVKSSILATHDPDERGRALLKKAAKDLGERLSSREGQSTWESALHDADLALESGLATSMKTLLRIDSLAAEAGDLRLKRAVLGAAVFHAVDPCALSDASCLQPEDSIEPFTHLKTIVIQQAALTEVSEFLRNDLDA